MPSKHNLRSIFLPVVDLPRCSATLTLMALAAASSGCVPTDSADPLLNRGVVTPVRAGGTHTFAQISAGFRHTCALTADGAAWCWGANDRNQLGVDSLFPSCQLFPCTATAHAVSGSLRFRQIIAGSFNSCGLATNGQVYCWGELYRWGDTLELRPTPALVPSDSLFTSIAGGDAHYCGLTASGVAMCWGINSYGELGDTSRINRHAPVRVAGGQRFVAIAAHGANSCGLTASGAIFCWGLNQYGQVGIGNVPFNSFGLVRTYPSPISSTEAFAAIAVGGAHACALTTTGAARCWGENDNAQQLGDDSTDPQRGVPGPVAGGRVFDAISANTVRTCGHTATNAIYCWGSDYFGGLGDGQQVNGGIGHPVRALGGPYAAVSVGGDHTCALAPDGSAYCWGDGLYGQLGNGR